MLEAIAWGIGVGSGSWAIASVVKSLWGNKDTCDHHQAAMGLIASDMATIKTGLMLLSAYCTRQADQEGIDLNERIIKTMMKKDVKE